MARDYYNILGVSKNSTDEEIKKAYRKLAHKFHPDKKGGDEAKFKELNEAYQVLSNKEKRQQYDQFGTTFEDASRGGASGFSWQDFSRSAGNASWSDFFRQGRQGGQAYQNFGFEDISDIFGDIFGFGSKRSRTKARGHDIEASLNIDFKEAVFGTEKIIDLYKTIECPKCQATGAEPGSKIETCKTCKGQGQVEQVQNSFFGQIRSVGVCPTCQGQGKKAKTKCHNCRGLGLVKGNQRIKVKIPAGIDSGQSIRLSGQGEIGDPGSMPGDLYIRINVPQDPYFKRHGYDVVTEKEITFSEAALGTKKEIETLDGMVNLKIPSGTQSDKTFRLKGKGIPQLRSSNRGDHFVKVIVKTPEKLSRKEKKLFEELAEEE